MGPDRPGRSLGVGIRAFERRSVGLIPEPRPIHFGLVARSAAIEAHWGRPERDTENPADRPEILVDEVVPLVVEAGLPIPRAGRFLGRVRKLVDGVDRDFDYLGHGGSFRSWVGRRGARTVERRAGDGPGVRLEAKDRGEAAPSAPRTRRRARTRMRRSRRVRGSRCRQTRAGRIWLARRGCPGGAALRPCAGVTKTRLSP